MQKIDFTKQRLLENLDKIPPFLEVARRASISRAAPAIRLSQSALSHLISNLESSLELKLFKRKSHGLELTDAGKSLMEFALRLQLDVESLASRLSSPEGRELTNLRVGTHETLAAHIWPKALPKIALRYPDLKVTLLSGRVDGLIEMLHRSELHAVVTVEPRADRRLRISTLYSGRLQLFAAVDSPYPKKAIPLSQLRGATILTDTNAHVRQGLPIPEALQRVGLDPMGRFEVSSFEAAINLAEIHCGIAAIPDRNAEHAVKAKRLRKLVVKELEESPWLQYSICLSTLAGEEAGRIHERLAYGFPAKGPS